MKKSALPLLLTGLLAACSANQQSATTPAAPTQPAATVGNDRDAHGCIGSAGSSWSELRQECVQVFEVGQRLNPVAPSSGQAVVSAFVLLNEPATRGELFLPQQRNSVLLDQSAPGQFSSGPYRFDRAAAVLYVDGKPAYRAGK